MPRCPRSSAPGCTPSWQSSTGSSAASRTRIRAAGQAEELYPDDPQDDPSFLYAEFTPASLTLERGLAYVALAEQFPGRGYQQKAAGIFGQAQADRTGSPDRIRFEIVNHQASTAVCSVTWTRSRTHMMRGRDGAAAGQQAAAEGDADDMGSRDHALARRDSG